MKAVQLAIRQMREARDIHEQWADRLESGELWFQETDTRVNVGGDVDWHREWVRRYNRVLRLLEKIA